MTTIDDVILRIPDWRKHEVRAAPLSGGRTNANYLWDVNGAS